MGAEAYSSHARKLQRASATKPVLDATMGSISLKLTVQHAATKQGWHAISRNESAPTRVLIHGLHLKKCTQALRAPPTRVLILGSLQVCKHLLGQLSQEAAVDQVVLQGSSRKFTTMKEAAQNRGEAAVAHVVLQGSSTRFKARKVENSMRGSGRGSGGGKRAGMARPEL